jgi:hypothetical protein
MIKYLNQGLNSNVEYYLPSFNSILVRFRGGAEYLYTNEATGEYHVNNMKQLASIGKGLTSYINRRVKFKYAKKTA